MKKIQSHTIYNGGQAILIAVTLFVVITAGIVLGVTTPVLSHVKNSKGFIESRQSYFLAEAGIEDVVYRLKNGISVSPTETLTLNGQSVNTVLSDSSGTKIIVSEANHNGIIRKIESRLEQGEGVAFNYGVQTGNGGFFIGGGGAIHGNVYSNGSIVGDSGQITGTAIAANSASLSAAFSNSCPTTPPHEVVFANSSGSQDFAQSFQVSESGALNKVRVYLRRTHSVPNGTLTVKVVSDNNGNPSTNELASIVVDKNTVPTSFNGTWTEVVFSNYAQLLPGNTYWIVLDSSSDHSSRFYTVGASATYVSYTGKIGRLGSSWGNTSPSGIDGCSEVYMGGIMGIVEGKDGSWHLAVGGDSWAHNVSKTNTSGIIYCQNGTGNGGGKTCDTSRPDPSPQAYPVPDSVIQSWKDGVRDAVAESGWTHNGNLTISSQGTTTTSLRKVTGNLTIQGETTLGAIEVEGNVSIGSGRTLVAGPMKIGGNLNVGSTGLTLTGTVWVLGDVTISSGASVRLHSSYGASSGTLVTDGTVRLNGGGNFGGSGDPKSFPLIITTSSCPYSPGCNGADAIHLSGGADAVILNAQKGNILVNGGGSATSLTGYKITVTGGGDVYYDNGLADINFSSGPSGGWEIQRWREVE